MSNLVKLPVSIDEVTDVIELIDTSSNEELTSL
jgi:hypothetical protein